ncbi:MAG: SURF1 family protein [Xanthomonadales bacterium]|nr:SURF1 family protein [Xanthomonadales bacterium]MBK7143649.1 SURF1 family protein [Xanthomonadales bacterium]
MSVFRQTWLRWSLLLAAECLFLGAATWQWQRAQLKDRRDREFAAALAEGEHAPHHEFAGLRNLGEDFSAARLRGRLRLDRLVLHDNRMRDGQYGVEVYAPLAIEGGYVLVDLGWLAADRSRRSPPVLPPIDVDFEAAGLVAPAPAIGLLGGRGGATESGRPDLRLSIDPAAIAAESRLQPMLDHVFWPAPEAGSPFRRDWRPGGIDGDRHRGYALQWASFAVVALLLFLILSIRREEVRR